VLPGGRNSGQKAQKGPEKKKFDWKNLWPNYGRISSKVADLAELFSFNGRKKISGPGNTDCVYVWRE
jgi:hypothetical protein